MPARTIRMPLTTRLPGVAVVIMAALVAGPANADHAAESIVTFQFENDFVANSDGQFSHGTRIAWMSPEDHVPEWAKRLADWVPPFDTTRSKRIVYSFGQSIFTPDDITIDTLIVGDRPYAGWLYAAIGLVSVSDTFMDNLELNVGVVGPVSLAETTHKAWHRWFGFRKPQGWDHQLENEPTFQLFYERKWRAWRDFGFLGFQGDASPHAGVALGNALVHGAGGLTLRVGFNLPQDYGPPRIRPSLPGSDFFAGGESFGGYLFAGGEGRVVGRNIFLDGNSFRDSHSVDKKYLTGDLQAGVAAILGNVRLAYTHVFRTKEFDGQASPEQFGAFSLSYRF